MLLWKGFGESSMRSGKDQDMTMGSLWQHIIRFAVPMAIGLLFQQLYNTVDTIVVGNFVGKEALAAVGCNNSIINMIVGTFSGLSTGASVVISQSYGAHDAHRLHRAVQTTICVTFILSILGTVAGILLVGPLLRLNNTPMDVWKDASDYLTIYFSGVTGVMVYNMGSGIMRAVGDSRRPLYFLVVSAITNTALDLLFVVQFDMGVRGVAYATIIAQALSALLVLISLSHTDSAYAIKWNKLCLDMPILKNMLKIGLPGAIQSGITAFSNVFVQSYINNFGSDCMAGYAAYNKLDSFVMVPMQAIAMGSTTLVGQNWGAGLRKRARDGVAVALKAAVLCTMVLSLGMILFARPLLTLINRDEGMLEYGVYFVRVITPFYFCLCFNQIYAGALRGIGNATTPTVIMLGSFVAFRQAYLFVTHLLSGSRFSVAMAYPLGWVMCSSLLFIFYRKSALYKTDDKVMDVSGEDS